MVRPWVSDNAYDKNSYVFILSCNKDIHFRLLTQHH